MVSQFEFITSCICILSTIMFPTGKNNFWSGMYVQVVPQFEFTIVRILYIIVIMFPTGMIYR